MAMHKQISKVLPFDTKDGKVPGHEVAAYSLDKRDPVDQVVFKAWDDEAQMTIETHVHWTKVSEWLRRKSWSGEPVAVILLSGRRLHAKSWYVAHEGAAASKAAPILARGVFKITLYSGIVLWEIVGVSAWSHSKRDAEATAKHLPCPWERDNAAFRAQHASVA